MDKDYLNRKTEEFKYDRELLWKDIKWGIRALIVIAFLVALKFLGER